MSLRTAWHGLLAKSGVGAPSAAGESRSAAAGDVAHLHDFVTTRAGVEAYLEPPTTVVPPTLLLIATDGEWTRRRVPDRRAAESFSEREQIPLYDVNFTGYPARMREWTARARRGQAQAPDLAG